MKIDFGTNIVILEKRGEKFIRGGYLMEFLILTIDMAIVGIFTILLIMVSLDKAREEKIRGKTKVREFKVTELNKVA